MCYDQPCLSNWLNTGISLANDWVPKVEYRRVVFAVQRMVGEAVGACGAGISF